MLSCQNKLRNAHFIIFTWILFGGHISNVHASGDLNSQQAGENYRIYVKSSGSSNPGCGLLNDPCASLQNAYNRIGYPGVSSYDVILIADDSYIPVSQQPEFENKLDWTKSGSDGWPIKIYSYGATATVSRPIDGSYMLEFENVSHITLSNIKFEKAAVGILLSNCDYCRLERLRIEGSVISNLGGAGSIWVGKNSGWDKEVYKEIEKKNIEISDQRSDDVEIADNYIYGSSAPNDPSRYHGVYISHGSKGTVVERNFIESNADFGAGIAFNHGYMRDNVARNNVITKIGGGPAIILGWENPDEQTTISNNVLQKNILWGESYGNLINVDAPLGEHNTIVDNKILYSSQGVNKLYDGMWVGYAASQIGNRVVSGDFDNDGKEDDIAAFYDYGSGETRIHVFLGKDGTFDYQGSGGWWSATGYSANKINGRIVSGDFDSDGVKDDIAAFYDYGNGEARIHVWRSTGSSFIYSYSTGWWSAGSGYDVSQITDRVVSGDFDRDGTEDDIAVFYRYGDSVTRTHVWLGQGNNFEYQGSSGWWSSNGYYANRITGRVVSGDFDRDSIKDDIAAFYDYENGYTRIHVWLGQGDSFEYQNPNGWWESNGGYTASKITGRVIAGDFNRDGKEDDIAAFYDYGGVGTRMHSWYSMHTSFQYSGSLGRWLDTTYDSSRITGRVLVGCFEGSDCSRDDVIGFYDTSLGSAFGVRMHVWEGAGTSSVLDSYLGYPWQRY